MYTLRKLITALNKHFNVADDYVHPKSVVVRVNGRDHVVANVSESSDGVLGSHVIIEAESLSDHV